MRIDFGLYYNYFLKQINQCRKGRTDLQVNTDLDNGQTYSYAVMRVGLFQCKLDVKQIFLIYKICQNSDKPSN